MFTLINNIYRREEQTIDVSINTIVDRWYDVHASVLAFVVRCMMIEEGYAVAEILIKDIEKRTNLSVASIYAKKQDSVRKNVPMSYYPMFDALNRQLQKTDNNS